MLRGFPDEDGTFAGRISSRCCSGQIRLLTRAAQNRSQRMYGCYSQNMADNPSRRGFLASAGAAAVAAPGILRAQNANGKVHIGWIGVGSRGYYLMDRIYTGSGAEIEVTAVCDTYKGNLNRAKDRVQT